MKRRAEGWNNTRPQPLSAADRARLVQIYADHIERTASLLGRDLSAWKAV